jgi:site-specific DNA-cytosine methylase
MRVLDLCCGLGGWGAAFRARGHVVVGVDVVPPADILADVRDFKAREPFDVIVASPPCTEFSREDMPWHRRGIAPDLSVWNSCVRVIQEVSPRYHIIENVRGAVEWIGPCSQIIGPRYLWGNFPLLFGFERRKFFGKTLLGQSPNRARLRSLIPYALSLGACIAIEISLENCGD